MKKIAFLSILISILVISTAHIAGANKKKEGDISAIIVHSGTLKILALEKGTGVFNWEDRGIWKEDSEDGPFHNSVLSCAGVDFLLNGVGKGRGYCIATAPNGDNYVLELAHDNVKLEHGLQEIGFKIIGGTGQFSGIQGEGALMTNDPLSIREETYQDRWIRVKGRYTLP